MCFRTKTFLLEVSIKRSTANLQIPGRRKKRVQRDKNGNAINVVFYAILANPSYMQFLPKSQNTKVTNTRLKISYSNTMSHIGFRKRAMLEST